MLAVDCRADGVKAEQCTGQSAVNQRLQGIDASTVDSKVRQKHLQSFGRPGSSRRDAVLHPVTIQ
jgi:hypothetical protein